MNAASLIRLVLLGAIWGASFLFMKIAAPVFGPPLLIEVRLLLAALFLAAVTGMANRALNLRENWRHYLIVGGVNSAIPFLCFAYAALTLPASLLALFNSLAALFGAVVGAVWLNTPITRATMAGLVSGVAGVALLTVERIWAAGVNASAFELTAALAAGIFAPACYGWAGVYIKKISAKIDPYANAHGAMWGASLVALPLALLFPPAGELSAQAIGAAVALGLLCTGAAYLLQFRLYADVGATRALSVSFLIPAFGVLWSMIFLDERLTWTLAMGGALILLGTALVNGFVDWPASSAAKRT